MLGAQVIRDNSEHLFIRILLLGHKYKSRDKKCHTATSERVRGFPTGVGYACMDAICYKLGRDDHEAEPPTIKNIGACEGAMQCGDYL